MNGEDTGKIVRFSYDPANPPRLSDEERKRLHAIRDEDIDSSDIPPITDFSGFTRPGRLTEEHVRERAAEAELRRVRLEPDVLAYFLEHRESPAKVNAILREYVEAHRS